MFTQLNKIQKSALNQGKFIYFAVNAPEAPAGEDDRDKVVRRPFISQKPEQGILGKIADYSSRTYNELLKAIVPGAKTLTREERNLLAEIFPSGIHNSDFFQGNIGDCYLLATLSVLKQNPIAPYLFAQMIKKTATGWEVTFPGTIYPIKVEKHELRGREVEDKKQEKKFSNKLLSDSPETEF